LDPVKRKTILSEIEHWRNSKLLPEHYCDFLKNLYIEEEVGSKTKVRNSPSSGSWQIFRKSFLIFSLISLFLVCSLYFTSFHPVMQIGISVIIIGIIYSIGIVKRQSKPIIAYIYVGLASMSLLFVGELILAINEWESAPALISTIVFSGGVWILIGLFARIALLHFCGWAYMIMAYTMLIHWIHPDPKWYILQLYAIPMFVVLLLLGRSRLETDRINGWLLIVISCMFFLIPEGFGLFVDISYLICIIGIISKLLCLSFIIWLLLRKPKTEEWITG
jgi:hypothetical protein